MKKWNWASDECIIAFWELFVAGGMPKSIHQDLSARFEGLPSTSTFAYRLVRERIRPEFERVTGNDSRITAAFADYRRRAERTPISAVVNPAPSVVVPPLSEDRDSVVGLHDDVRAPRVCVGLDGTCGKALERGSYCKTCAVVIYGSDEEIANANYTVAGQVAGSLPRSQR